jgi:N-carbamoyl-L-amino-acid hydrolase
MQLRHDAGYCASRIGVFVRDLAKRMGNSQVATVGMVRLKPNLINVIPNQAVVSVDLRNTDDARLSAAERDLSAFLEGLAQEEGVTIEARCLVRTAPVIFDANVLQVIEAVAAERGLPIRRMTSGAGHDAQMMARICPTAMIFVPSVAGISHNPREFTERRHLQIGADTLMHAMLRLAAT